MTVLHRGEEHGQARELKMSEVLAFGLISCLKSVAWGIGATVAVTWGRLSIGERVTAASALLTGSAVFAVSVAIQLLGDLDTLVDGLRSWRSVETFAPPQPKPQPETSHPPIVVRPYQGDPYTIGQPHTPALPGREPLQLTPPVVAEILQAVVEQYGGEWSRRKLTRLRVSGQKVSRGVYEELTRWLAYAGVLLQTPQGGYKLPPDVAQFDDLRIYFPSLPTPPLIGPGIRRPSPAQSPTCPPTRPAVNTLAERRRQRWLECGCDAEAYRVST